MQGHRVPAPTRPENKMPNINKQPAAEFINTTLEELYYQDEEPLSETYADDLFETTTQDDFIPSNWKTYS